MPWEHEYPAARSDEIPGRAAGEIRALRQFQRSCAGSDPARPPAVDRHRRDAIGHRRGARRLAGARDLQGAHARATWRRPAASPCARPPWPNWQQSDRTWCCDEASRRRIAWLTACSRCCANFPNSPSTPPLHIHPSGAPIVIYLPTPDCPRAASRSEPDRLSARGLTPDPARPAAAAGERSAQARHTRWPSPTRISRSADERRDFPFHRLCPSGGCTPEIAGQYALAGNCSGASRRSCQGRRDFAPGRDTSHMWGCVSQLANNPVPGSLWISLVAALSLGVFVSSAACSSHQIKWDGVHWPLRSDPSETLAATAADRPRSSDHR